MQKLITRTSLLTKSVGLIRPMINLVGNGQSGSSSRVPETNRVSDMTSTSTMKKSYSTASHFAFPMTSAKNKYNRIMLDGKRTTIRSCPPVKLDVYISGKEGFTDADGDKWFYSQENGGNMKNYGNGWVIDKDGKKAPVKTVAIPQNQLCDCDGTCELTNCCGKGGVFNAVMITDRIGTYAMNITYDPIEAEKKSRILEAVWFDHPQLVKLLDTRSAHRKESFTESPNKSNTTYQSRSGYNDEQDSYERHNNIIYLISAGILTFCVGFPLVSYFIRGDIYRYWSTSTSNGFHKSP